MEEGDTPALGVGFEIDFGDSFGKLRTLDDILGETAAVAVRQFNRMKAASGGAVDLAQATASIRAYGSAATREAQNLTREKNNTARAAETLIKQLDREAAALGKTRDQLRDAKVETLALAAAAQKNTEVADRLLAAARNREAAARSAAEAEAEAAARAAAAAEQEAQAIREATNAYRMFEAVARQKSAAYAQSQAQEAAALRDAQAQSSAADRLRASIDPAVAAQQRFNREMGEARTLIGAGKISLDEYVAKLRMERAALANSADQHGRAAGAAVKTRIAMQGATYQTQDFFTQVSMGANPINAFAVQGAQLAGQFADVEGKAGNVARFFMGPWGLAITAGLMLLGPFVGKLLEHNNALEDAVDKLKKDAQASETAAKAKDIFTRSVEGLTQATLDNKKALDQLDKSAQTSIQTTLYQIAHTIDSAEAKRLETAETIRALEAEIELNKERARVAGNDARITGTLNAQSDAARARVEQLKKDMAATEGVIQSNKTMLEDALSRRVVEIATQQSDAFARIKRQYEGPNGLIELARKSATAEEVRNGTLARQVAVLKQKQAADEEAERKRQQGMQRTAQIGREIDLAEARRIAQSIGARITSERRSYEEQKRLYDKYMAYKAGKGPWAALAAAPGTSDHELGNALDIAKTPGMSLAKIREAYRAAGVSIKQLLDEGDHFHISWKKGADAAAAASKKLADVQADLAKKFDPAEAAALEYRAALKSIADAKLDPATATRYAAAAKDAFIEARAAAFSLPSMAEIAPAAEAEQASAAAAAEFQANVIQPLKDQLALYGLVGAARDRAALGLEKEAFLAANAAEGPAVALARWQEYYAAKSALIDRDDAAEREAATIRNLADQFDYLLDAVDRAGDGFARSFGRAGEAVADLLHSYTDYASKRQRINEKLRQGEITQAQAAKQTGAAQIGAYGDALSAAKGFFDEKSRAYKALTAAEQAFRAVQLAMSIASMFQDTAETVSHVANAGARATANAAEGVSAQAKLPFPANIAAMAATAAAVVAFGIALLGGGGGGRSTSAPRSSEDIQKATGIGTVLGSPNDKSASIARSIDLVAKNTDGVLDYNSQMLNSLRSIDASIGAMAATVAKQINVAGSLYDTSKLSIGSSGSAGFLGLFSSSTTRTLYDAGITLAAATVGDIIAHGIAGQTYQIVQQVKKSSGFLGIGGGTRTTYQTTTGGLPSDITASIQSVIAALESGIVTAAGAIGIDGAKAMLDNFTVTIGQLSFNGLDAQGIEDQLNAVFSSVGDQMVSAVLPGIAKFQKVGEGLFETLERVATTVVVVDGVMQKLGRTNTTLGIDVDMAIAGLFDSVGDFKSAADAYFETYYSTAEQTAAKAAQIGKVFGSLGLAMPSTLAAFRALVDAQDLTTAAGQATYATLLQLAPAFADLQAAMSGAKSAADILSERQDLERQLLELQGNTDAIRQLDLAKLDESNRALQLQIWAIQDAQEAAKAADELRQAWQSVGDSIMDEVKRIRGLNDATGAGSFASLMGQFNATTALARSGDQDAAKSLPQLSQALLAAAANAATSQQELARVQAQTAASLESTYGMISQFGTTASSLSDAALLAASSTTAQASGGSANDNANTDLLDELAALREEVAGMRSENASGHAATAGNTAAMNRKLDAVTADSGGTAISIREVDAA